MKKVLLSTAILFSALALRAQNDPNITHWYTMRGVFNPASAASNKGVEAAILQREQWFGLENRPGTSFLNAGYYIAKANSAVGISGFYDRVGFQRNTNIKVNNAYHVTLNEKTFLSVGVGAGFINTSTRMSDLNFSNPNDPLIGTLDQNRWQPDVSIGIEAVHQNYTVGVAVPHVIGSPGSKHPYWARTIHAYGNYRFRIRSKVTLVPGVLVRTTFFKTQFEGNLTGYFLKERFWVGLGYRYQDAGSLLLGVHMGKGLRLMYSFDYTLSRMQPYNTGTHELGLSFSWKKPHKPTPSLLNPRDF